MKMVAAAKLRHAQNHVEAIRPYEGAMYEMVEHLLRHRQDLEDLPVLMTGQPDHPTHLLIVVTADRGLCGGFNGNVVRKAKNIIPHLRAQGKIVKIFCWGRKGRELLHQSYGDLIVETLLHDHKMGGNKNAGSYEEALAFTTRLPSMLQNEDFGEASILFTVFHTILYQEVVHHSLVPFHIDKKSESSITPSPLGKNALYEFEPHPDALLAHLLPRYLAIQIYRALLENSASEQGARMTAMDNATRNADEITQKLARIYNQTRQAYITKELIEIISAAEAM